MSNIKDNFLSLSAVRLKDERLRLGINQAEAGDLCGVSREMWGKYERGAAVPGGEVLFSFASAGADVQYVLTGERKSLHQVSDQIAAPCVNSEYAEIAHFDVKVAAGNGAINTVELQLKPLAFRRDWLVARGLAPANLVIVEVTGDSMEPNLKDKDLVLVDRSQVSIASGKTYVLRMDGHLLVKNLQILPYGLIQVASFNAGFPPYQVDLSNEALDMAVIGRVVASMHEW